MAIVSMSIICRAHYEDNRCLQTEGSPFSICLLCKKLRQMLSEWPNVLIYTR